VAVSPIGPPPLSAGGVSRHPAGTVFELDLNPWQVGYVQLACTGWHAPVIRICPGVFDSSLGVRDVRSLVAGASLFRTQCAIDQIVGARKGRVLGRLPVRDDEATIPPFRILTRGPSDQPSITVGDGSTISEDEFRRRYPQAEVAAIPEWAIPFPATLTWMMEVQWTPRIPWSKAPDRPSASWQPDPENDLPVIERPKRRTITTGYLSVFASEDAARLAATEFTRLGFTVETAADDLQPGWVVWANRTGRANQQIEADVNHIAAAHLGRYDGHLRHQTAAPVRSRVARPASSARPVQAASKPNLSTARRLMTTHLAVFATRKAAEAAEKDLLKAMLITGVGPASDSSEWCIWVHQDGPPDHAIEDTLTEIATRHGGQVDGNIVGPFGWPLNQIDRFK
jgi:hypothetical protein